MHLLSVSEHQQHGEKLMKMFVAVVLALSLSSGAALANGQSLPPKTDKANSQKVACLACCNHSCNGAVALALPPTEGEQKPILTLAGLGWSGFQGNIRIDR